MSSSDGSKGWAPISTDDDPSIYERPPARGRMRRRIQDCGCGALLAVVLLTGVWAVSAPCCTPALQDQYSLVAQGCAPLARVRCIAVLRDGRGRRSSETGRRPRRPPVPLPPPIPSPRHRRRPRWRSRHRSTRRERPPCGGASSWRRRTSSSCRSAAPRAAAMATTGAHRCAALASLAARAMWLRPACEWPRPVRFELRPRFGCPC